MKRLLAVSMFFLLIGVGNQAFASPFTIVTTDFSTLFGTGSLVTLPDAVGGGTTGSADIIGGGVSGTIGFAVWKIDDLLVFAYEIHAHDGSHPIEEFVVDNPHSYVPAAIASGPGGGLTDSGSGLGYVTADTGATPLGSELKGGPGGDLGWFFGNSFVGSPIGAGGESVRLYAAFYATAVGSGEAELRNGVVVGGSGIPIPTPEPASLILMGSGLAALGAWRRKKLKDMKA